MGILSDFEILLKIRHNVTHGTILIGMTHWALEHGNVTLQTRNKKIVKRDQKQNYLNIKGPSFAPKLFQGFLLTILEISS